MRFIQILSALSHLSFRLSRCISDPRCGWAKDDVFSDDRCLPVDEREKAVAVLGDEAVKGVGWTGDEI